MSNEIIIYGASDDLVEIDGAIRAEFGCYDRGWTGILTAPDGEQLIVRAEYGKSKVTDWLLSVENTSKYPAWPIRFGERPDREGDPAIIIDAPEGTTIEEIQA